ncbi:putative gustatory receptor clone PTE01 [Nannospalax galili]|uniref:putative gustatory receptor clone PTE01 n=1 Tax=Nannospalax galili TaxID=1026970 RepID=UPI000819EF74|nr:putative gustatory receptor clone PTE01 [Nannospalax galili]
MAYDRFVAICHPLNYQVLMTPYLCTTLLLVLASLLYSKAQYLIALNSTCLKDVEISTFFCESSQVLSLACCDTISKSIVKCVLATIYGLFTISWILFSYIPSSGIKYKTFSTCGSYL